MTCLLRGLLGAVSLAALIGMTGAWVNITMPFDPVQITPPRVVAAEPIRPGPEHPDVIPVLAYHGISETTGSDSTLSVRLFAEHMATLHRAGYQTVRLADVERLLAGDATGLPAKPLLLTFDDGNLSDWTVADPTIRQYGFTAVCFPIVGSLVAPGTPSSYLSTGHLRRMSDTGRWEFGAHGWDAHTLVSESGALGSALVNRAAEESTEQWRERVVSDLARAQQALTSVLGEPVRAFSYPFGDSGDGDAETAETLPTLVQDAGFRLAFAGEDVPTGHVDAVDATSQPWRLTSLGVRSTTSATDLLDMIREAVPGDPPSSLAALDWEGSGALCRPSDGDVSLLVLAESYGSCQLGGLNTSRWRDYTVTARIRGVDRLASAVVAVRDGLGAGHRGRVEVVRGESTLVVRQSLGDGVWEVLGTARVGRATIIDISITVRDDQVTVWERGGVVLSSDVDSRIDRGAVRLAVATETDRPVIFRNLALMSLL